MKPPDTRHLRRVRSVSTADPDSHRSPNLQPYFVLDCPSAIASGTNSNIKCRFSLPNKSVAFHKPHAGRTTNFFMSETWTPGRSPTLARVSQVRICMSWIFFPNNCLLDVLRSSLWEGNRSRMVDTAAQESTHPGKSKSGELRTRSKNSKEKKILVIKISRLTCPCISAAESDSGFAGVSCPVVSAILGRSGCHVWVSMFLRNRSFPHWHALSTAHRTSLGFPLFLLEEKRDRFRSSRGALRPPMQQPRPRAKAPPLHSDDLAPLILREDTDIQRAVQEERESCAIRDLR